MQWRIACETERVADLRPGSEFPNEIAGTVLFTNTHFVVLGDDERVTTVRHDGRNFTVGENVALGWHWCPSSKGEGAEDHVFTATNRRREHHASLDISIVRAEPARNHASGR